MKRICKQNPELLIAYIDRFLTEIANINQASTQWTLAQLFLMLQAHLSEQQKTKAVAILKNNLEHHNDWIVLNMTMETLGKWAKKDTHLKEWLIPQLQRISTDTRKSVAKKAKKTREALR